MMLTTIKILPKTKNDVDGKILVENPIIISLTDNTIELEIDLDFEIDEVYENTTLNIEKSVTYISKLFNKVKAYKNDIEISICVDVDVNIEEDKTTNFYMLKISTKTNTYSLRIKNKKALNEIYNLLNSWKFDNAKLEELYEF
jgi:hypothetical protein